MKKFIIIAVTVILLLLFADTAYYKWGWYVPDRNQEDIRTFTGTEGKTMLLDRGDGMKPFEIKGVDFGVGIPGHFSTDYAIDKETYLRWFHMIQDMGANTVRVYTIQDDDFYNAVYEYNKDNPDPLYFIHGLWVNDYVQFSHVDAYDESFYQTMKEDASTLIDIIHGKKKLSLGRGNGSGIYKKDISDWVIGYILGVEWEDTTVAYTNHMETDKNSYTGKYMYTSPEATPFEAMLAGVGDYVIGYETGKYGQQRLVAFANWPTTDPLDYPEEVRTHFKKAAKVNVEHIKTTENFLSGQFASYHIYPYFPDYLNYYEDWKTHFSDKTAIMAEYGIYNTYRAYLTMINQVHSMPVVISEFGVPTSRGMAQRDFNTGRSQGFMSEAGQGDALIQSYEDIKNAGCSGAIIFTWQDEWFKRTWNTMHAVDLTKTAYWSDYQTNEQYFGLLSFDPGKEKSVCYVDGDTDEWSQEDLVMESEGLSLSMKADEKFIYFLVRKEGFAENKDTLYLPVDTTPKTGSVYDKNHGVKFERPADFVIVIDGKDNSRVLVQERYEVLRAMFGYELNRTDSYAHRPDKNSPIFRPIYLLLQAEEEEGGTGKYKIDYYETGMLTYGDANPEHKDYNSLADFIFRDDYIEIKLPWQLLNFSNPAEQQVHDDYYECYGVENLKIDSIYVGVGIKDGKDSRIPMGEFRLKGWGRNPTYHERLKQSYYAMKDYWTRPELQKQETGGAQR